MFTKNLRFHQMSNAVQNPSILHENGNCHTIISHSYHHHRYHTAIIIAMRTLHIQQPAFQCVAENRFLSPIFSNLKHRIKGG